MFSYQKGSWLLVSGWGAVGFLAALEVYACLCPRSPAHCQRIQGACSRLVDSPAVTSGWGFTHRTPMAISWLSCLFMQMSEHYWAPQSNVSNETSTAKTFQRTISAQVCVGLGRQCHTCFISLLAFQLVSLVLATSACASVPNTVLPLETRCVCVCSWKS